MRLARLGCLKYSRQIRTPHTAGVVHVVGNPLWTLGSQFIEPIDELCIAATLTNEAEDTSGAQGPIADAHLSGACCALELEATFPGVGLKAT